MMGDGVPSYEELFAQQQGGLGSGYPLGSGGAGWPGEQSAMPPAAAPTNGVGPPPTPQYQQPPLAAPQGAGLGEALAARSNSLVGMGLGMMGGGWAGGARGYAAGSAVDQHAMAAQMAQRQHAAALAQQEAHFQRQQALAEAPQLVKVKGLLGEELMLRDPRSGKLTPYAGGGAGAPGASEADDRDENGYSPKVLETIRQKHGNDVAAGVKAMAEGRMPAAGFGAMKQLGPLAAQYKEGFDAKDYQTWLASQKSFESGKDAETTRRMNQAYFHANKAWDLSEKLGGAEIGGPIGAAANYGYSTYRQTTDPKYTEDEAEYRKQATFLSNELIAAAKGGGSDVHAAREAATSLLASANSPGARRGALKGALDLLEGINGGLEQKRAFGLRHGWRGESLLAPEARSVIEKIQTGETAPAASGQAGAGTGTEPARAQPGAVRSGTGTPPAPAPGMKIQINRGTGQWREVPANG